MNEYNVSLCLECASDSSQATNRNLRFLVALVCEFEDVESSELFAPSRGAVHVAFARHMAVYLAVTSLDLSLTQVGKFFSRDRTSVAHAIGKIEDSRDDHGIDLKLDLIDGALKVFASETFEVAA